jgi:hypothetical protein
MTARRLGPDRANIKLETGATGSFHPDEPTTINNVYGLDNSFYDHDGTHLSHSKFRDPPWPSAEAVATYYDRNHIFYREFMYSNVHACLLPLSS